MTSRATQTNLQFVFRKLNYTRELKHQIDTNFRPIIIGICFIQSEEPKMSRQTITRYVSWFGIWEDFVCSSQKSKQKGQGKDNRKRMPYDTQEYYLPKHSSHWIETIKWDYSVETLN